MKKNSFFIKSSVLIIFISSCLNNGNQQSNQNKPENKNVPLINQIKLDSLFLDKIESSYLGDAQIHNDSIYFVDTRFGWIYVFDKEGVKLNRYLGSGNGPKELPTGQIDGFLLFTDKNNSHVFWDPGLRYFKFSRNFEIERNISINKHIHLSHNDLLKKGEISMMGIYSFTHDRNIVRNYNGNFYSTIYTEHPNFNFFKKIFYKESRILAEISVENADMLRILGNYPPIYRKYKYLPQFSNVSYDVSKTGVFYIGFDADSLIHVTDINFKTKNCFGVRGKLMDTGYKEIADLNTFLSEYKKERFTKGYYSWIEYIDELNLLFRSYTRGNLQKYDGLQIYKDGVLVADFDVPKKFEVMGYIPPNIYSRIIIDELKEEIKVYKINVNQFNTILQGK